MSGPLLMMQLRYEYSKLKIETILFFSQNLPFCFDKIEWNINLYSKELIIFKIIERSEKPSNNPSAPPTAEIMVKKS